MAEFVERESYAHKKSKEILYNWIEESNYNIDPISSGSGSTRTFIEYPITPEPFNSVVYLWDEQTDEKELKKFYDKPHIGCYTPTYEECINIHKVYPIAIVDLVTAYKGVPTFFIEICWKNPTSQEKIQKLKDAGVQQLIEIDAIWIMSQIKRPEKLQHKKLIWRY